MTPTKVSPAAALRALRRGAAICWLGAALVGSPAPLRAQAIQVRRVGPTNGLAGLWVLAVFQDSRGFMWFGTSNGLNRYDGYQMEVFRYQRGNPRSLPDDRVDEIVEDRAGVLWIGTRSGLSRYDRAHNDFTNYMVQSHLDLAARRRVYAIQEDRRGTLWVGTSEGLFRFDRRTGRETLVPLPVGGPSHLPNVQTLFEDAAGTLWVGTEADGLYALPLQGGIRQYTTDRGRGALPENDVRTIGPAPAGRLWLGTYDAGLALFDPRRGTVSSYRHDPRDPRSLSINRIRKLVVDARGGVWLATENGGLEYFDPASGVFQHHLADLNNPLALNNNSFWSLCMDRGGTLWAGSFSGGVNAVKRGEAAIRQYRPVLGDSTSLSGSEVLGFAEDSTGAVWVAIAGGGLDRLDPKTGRFNVFDTSHTNLNHPGVLAVTVDRDSSVWVGTWGHGISRFDRRTRQFTAYTSRNSNLPDDNIFSAYVDRQGRLWLGSHHEGLLLFDRKTHRFTTYPIGTPGGQSQIWLIYELMDGRLALGTLENGLILFDPATARMTRYRSDSRDRYSLSSYEVRALLQDRPDRLWVGTGSGLDVLDLRTGRAQRFAAADRVRSYAVSGLFRDAAGYLWVEADQGITRYDAAGNARTFNIADGLGGRSFTPRAYLRSHSGLLYFASETGITTLDPSRLTTNRAPPPVVLTGFQLSNREVPIGEPGSPLKSAIAETRHITLTHRQSVFTIQFAALDYTAPSKNRYSYRLDGFDHEWTRPAPGRAATYTSLPAGDYTFRVRASSSDGVWNEAGATLAITILPPWWRTWWFETLVALSVLSLVAALVRAQRRRNRALETMNERLAQAAERDRQSQQYLEGNVLEILGGMQRFADGDYDVALPVSSDDSIGKLRAGFNTVVADRKQAEEELRQSQKMEAVGRLAGGVAHDFNNLLTVIKGNTGLALTELATNHPVRDDLEEVHRAAERASSLTRQLLAFSRKQMLQPRVLSLNDIVRDMGRLLRRSVGEDIELAIMLDPALGQVRADPGQIEQVLLNLVVNARDAMPRGGTLVIDTQNVPAEVAREHPEAENIAYVSLRVQDTGMGMPPEVVQRIFEPFFTTKEQGKGTGLGLSTVYGIVKQSGGYVRVESQLDKGSSFAIYLPRVEAAAPSTNGRHPSANGKDKAPAGTGATVLLVEDEAAVRRLATRVLERSGYSVLTADSGAAALELMENFPGAIDLLLTDVVMPGMSGRELSEKLVPRHPGMRLLFTSGYTEDAIIRHGVSGLGAFFLGKPFTPDELASKVREVLDGRRA